MTRLFSLLFLVAMPHLASAAIETMWTYQWIFDRADLVVIAKPLSTTETRERADLNRLGLGSRADRPSADRDPEHYVIPLVGLETKFEVKAILKGNKKLQTFVIHHYRLATKPDTAFVGGAPALLTFDAGAPYLLFLVREPDGRYGPASDQQNPGRTCAFKLSPDLP